MMKKNIRFNVTPVALTLLLCLGVGRANAQIAASDDASAYSSLTSGENFGYGFTPWILAQNDGAAGSYTNYAGFFIGAAGNIDTSGKSFGMYANTFGGGTPYAIAYRGMSNALAPNQVFKVKFQNTGISSGGIMGFCLRSDGSTNFIDENIILDSNTRFAFYFIGGDADYYIWDGNGSTDSGIGWRNSGLSLELYLLSSDTYELIVKSADGSTTLGSFSSAPLAGSSGIVTFGGFALHCGSFESAYFNSLQVASVTTIPPAIANLSPPNGQIYVGFDSQFSFEVTSLFSTISSNGISLTVNGVNQTNQMSFTGSGTSDLQVTLNGPLQANKIYTGTIIATDNNGNHATNNFTFNTWLPSPANIFVEAEDYNYTFGGVSGRWLNNFVFPQPNQSYYGLFGSNGVDYLEYDLTGTNHPNYYRTNDLPQIEPATDVNHDYFADNGFQDYDLGFIQNGEWEDYTRNLSNVTYQVYARMAGFGDNATMLLERTASATVNSASQPRAALGTFVCPNTGGAQNWTFVQLKDFFGNPVSVNFPGTNTFRITDIGGDGNYNVNYLIFVATTNTATLRPYIASGFPYPGAGPIQPDTTNITFTIANRQTSVTSVQLSLNGTDVSGSLVFSNNAAGTVVNYASPNYLPGGTNTLQAIYSDGSVLQTNTWQFTVATLPVLSTGWALPAGSLPDRGFTLQIAKADDGSTNVDFPALVSRAESQLSGTLTNSQTSLPYANQALNGGSYTETNVINYAIDGLFNYLPYFGTPTNFPDLPAGTSNYIAMAATMYVQLSPGIYQFGVTSDDGFKFTAGATPADTNLVLGVFDGGRGGSETAFSFIVQTNGLYPMRLVYFKGQFGGGGVQLYTIDRSSGIRRLLNDPNDANALKVFYAPAVVYLQQSGTNVVLTWTDSSYSLQAAPQVTGTYTNIPGATSPYTVPVVGPQRFFRLSK